MARTWRALDGAGATAAISGWGEATESWPGLLETPSPEGRGFAKGVPRYGRALNRNHPRDLIGRSTIGKGDGD